VNSNVLNELMRIKNRLETKQIPRRSPATHLMITAETFETLLTLMGFNFPSHPIWGRSIALNVSGGVLHLHGAFMVENLWEISKG
jgi:hypothetical protein